MSLGSSRKKSGKLGTSCTPPPPRSLKPILLRTQASFTIHSAKQTWNLKGSPLTRTVIYKEPLFRFHVGLAERTVKMLAETSPKKTHMTCRQRRENWDKCTWAGLHKAKGLKQGFACRPGNHVPCKHRFFGEHGFALSRCSGDPGLSGSIVRVPIFPNACIYTYI